MKKLFTIILAFTSVILFAQAPKEISYQGIARAASGSLLSNQNIGIKLDLHQGSASGAIVFSETHNKTTNSFGLFTLGIGSVNTGVFSGLNWGAGPYFLEVSMDPAGGTSYSSVGAQQFMSVPYALYAETSGNAGSTPTITINAPNTVSSAAGSYSITVPAQTLSLNSNSLSISNGNTVVLPSSSTYSAGTGIDITGGVISNTATAVTPTITGAGSATVTSSGNTFTVTTPAQTSYTAGSGIDITGGIISNTATAVTPTITGAGSATVTSSGNTFTVNTPAQTSYTAGSGIDITGGIITNTAVSITPTITSTGIAVVTLTTGNVFNVDVPVPVLSYTPGTSVLSISQGTTVSTATLVGSGTNTIDIVGSGLATVTPTTGSTFTVSVPNPTLTINSGSLSISNGNTIALPEQSLSISSNSLTISGVGGNTILLPSASTTTLTQGTNINLTGTAPDYTISALTPTLTGAGTTTISGVYPNYTVTSASSPTTSISSGTNIIVNGTAPDYTISAVTPTLTGAGTTTITGTYPSYTVSSASSPSTSISSGTNVVVSGAYPNYTVSSSTPTLSVIGGTLTGAYPTQTLTIPTQTTYVGTTGNISVLSNTINLVPTGVTPANYGANASNAVPTFSVDTYGRLSTASQYTPSISGDVLGSINTSTVVRLQGVPVSTIAPAPNEMLKFIGGVWTPTTAVQTASYVSQGVANVINAAPLYTINVPMSTYNNNTGVFSTGAFTIAVTPTLSLAGNVLRSGPTTNTVSLPTPTVVSGNSNITVTPSGNTYSVSAVTPTLSVSGGVLTGAYPTQTLTIPTSSTTVISSTNIAITGTAPNYTLSSPSQSLSVNSNSLSITGANTVIIPTSSVVAGNSNITVTPSGNTYSVSTPNYSISLPGGNVVQITNGVNTSTAAIATTSLTLTGVNNNILSAGGNTVGLNTYTPGTGVAITGAAPNYTISSPNQSLTINSNSISITGGNTITIPTNSTTVISPSTNISVAGTAPNYTISSVTPTLSVIGGALSGSYPTQTLTIPTSSTTVITPSTNIIVAGTAPNYTLSSVTPTLTGTAGITVSGLYPNQTISSTQGLSIASNSIITLTPAGGNITITPAALTYTPSTNVLRLTDGLAINTHTLNNYTQGAGISVTGTAPNFTISNTSPAVTPTITGTGVATVNNVSPNYTVNVPMSTYNNNTGVFTTGTQTIAVTPTLTLSGTTLQSGSTTNTVNLSSINNWSVTSGVIYPSTLTNSVGVGINNSLGGRLGVSHTSSPASPHINIISPTISDFGRVKFSNTGSSRYFSFEARNNTGGVADAFNIAHNNGTNERQVFLINGDRNVFINNLNLPLTTFHVMTSTATAQGGIASEGFGQSGQLNLVRNNNAGAGPRTQVLINEELGKLNFSGYDGTTFGDGAKIYAKAAENVTGSNKGTELIFAAVPTGTNSNKDAFKINGTGNLEVISGLRIPLGAVAGHVLTSDATGNASWQPGAGLSPWIQGASIVTLSNIADKVGIGTNTPNASLDIKNNAASLDGLALDINNPSNGSNGLQLRHFGIGNAAYIEVNNSGSTASAIQAQHNGVGTVIYATNTNSTNTAAVIQAVSNSSGVAIYATNAVGSTSQFDNNSSSTAVNAINNSTGNALYASANTGNAINASSSGSTTPTALINNSGIGDGMQVFSTGSRAILAQSASNGTAALEVNNTGTGNGITAFKNTGTTGGNVARFTNNSTSNTADAVFVTNNGAGAAIHAVSGPTVSGGTNAAILLENGHIAITQSGPGTGISSIEPFTSGYAGATDVAGTIETYNPFTILTGTSGSITVFFGKNYQYSPIVTVTATSDLFSKLDYYVTSSASSFTINYKNSTGSSIVIAAPITQAFSYHVIGVQ